MIMMMKMKKKMMVVVHVIRRNRYSGSVANLYLE